MMTDCIGCKWIDYNKTDRSLSESTKDKVTITAGPDSKQKSNH